MGETNRRKVGFYIFSCVCVCCCVGLFVTPQTVAHQASLSMGFSRQEHGVGCHFFLQRIFLTQGSNSHLLHLMHWQVDPLPLASPKNLCSIFLLLLFLTNALFSLYLQCPWMSDVCLVQCARGNRPNSTNCIIFEINKFLIGLELVQERQLHLETNILKVEDDTNCSLSSIEEDFLTASEHLEEESEVEEYRNGENFPVK